jgi:hypothetical protein
MWWFGGQLDAQPLRQELFHKYIHTDRLFLGTSLDQLRQLIVKTMYGE